MDEDALNQQIRKFLKKVGITSQREIEKAVREGVASGKLTGNETLDASVTLHVQGVDLQVKIDDTVLPAASVALAPLRAGPHTISWELKVTTLDRAFLLLTDTESSSRIEIHPMSDSARPNRPTQLTVSLVAAE